MYVCSHICLVFFLTFFKLEWCFRKNISFAYSSAIFFIFRYFPLGQVDKLTHSCPGKHTFSIFYKYDHDTTSFYSHLGENWIMSRLHTGQADNILHSAYKSIFNPISSQQRAFILYNLWNTDIDEYCYI